MYICTCIYICIHVYMHIYTCICTCLSSTCKSPAIKVERKHQHQHHSTTSYNKKPCQLWRLALCTTGLPSHAYPRHPQSLWRPKMLPTGAHMTVWRIQKVFSWHDLTPRPLYSPSSSATCQLRWSWDVSPGSISQLESACARARASVWKGAP